MAALQGHDQCLRVLAELGAGESLSVAMNNGATPAYAAAQNGHDRCLRVLAELGAGESLSAADNDGLSSDDVLRTMHAALRCAMLRQLFATRAVAGHMINSRMLFLYQEFPL